MYASSYCVTNRRHSNKRSCPDSGASDDEIFDFSRWFVVQLADDKTSFNSLTAFDLGKALKAQIGTLVTVRCLQRGDILIETDNPTYASMLQKMDSLAHVPVKVTPHRTLNASKGIVRSRELASCDVAEILTELKPQGVIHRVPKKHVTTFSTITLTNKCPITIIFCIVSSKSMSHRKMVSFPTSPI